MTVQGLIKRLQKYPGRMKVGLLINTGVKSPAQVAYKKPKLTVHYGDKYDAGFVFIETAKMENYYED